MELDLRFKWKDMRESLCKRIRIWFHPKEKFPVPTLEDIKEAGQMAKEKGLKGESDKKTLDNIIEYQNKNIAYFNERTVVLSLRPYMLLLSSVTAIISLFWFMYLISLISRFDPLSQKGLIFISIAIFVLLWIINYKLIQLAIVMVTVDRFRKKMKWSKLLSRQSIESFRAAWKYTIQEADMPVRKILDWKLAICRDYAKLTASLLFNLCPDSELYFIAMPGHLVAGIKLDNEIYVLDPHYDNPTPPSVLKLDEWLTKNELNADMLFESKASIFTIKDYYT